MKKENDDISTNQDACSNPSEKNGIDSFVSDFTTKHKEGLKYIICGAGTCIIGWISYSLYVWLGIDPTISNILSWATGLLFAFVTNKWIVFESYSKEKIVILKEFGMFTSTRIFTGILSFILFPILMSIGLDTPILGIDGIMAKVIVTAIEIVINYILSKKFIFIKKNG